MCKLLESQKGSQGLLRGISGLPKNGKWAVSPGLRTSPRFDRKALTVLFRRSLEALQLQISASSESNPWAYIAFAAFGIVPVHSNDFKHLDSFQVLFSSSNGDKMQTIVPRPR